MPDTVIDVRGGWVHVTWHRDGPPTSVYVPDPDVWGPLLAGVTSPIGASLSRLEGKLDAVLAGIGRIEASEQTIIAQGVEELADLTALRQEVADTAGAEQSAIVLLQGLEEQLKNATSQTDIDALTAQLAASRAALAAAVANDPTSGGGDTGASG